MLAIIFVILPIAYEYIATPSNIQTMANIRSPTVTADTSPKPTVVRV